MTSGINTSDIKPATASEVETTNDDMDPDPADAYTKLSTKLKRGTGTRDQDVTKVVTRHPDPQAAAERHQHALEAAREAADAARTIQTEGDE